MTREEAKSELMQIYMSLSEKMKQALDVLMAQADGEYISKSDVLDLIEDMTDQFGVEHRVITEGMISLLPSVAIPNKVGHWIRCDILQEFKCSECRVCFRNKSNYCPNCGAKMD